MFRRQTSAIILLFLAATSPLFPQAVLPRTAIIPFAAIGTSKADAETLTLIFETALVKTGMFMVIEQNKVDEILQAQERSIADCTDERCAVEFGKLLAAEQIVMGSLSSLGGKFILTAKVIDITKGMNLRADKAEAKSVDELSDAADFLAYSLAGLTYRKEGPLPSSPSGQLGEIFVQTDRPGADVYVNGVKKGVSPLVVSKVPFGAITVEAWEGNYYAMKEFTVSSVDLQKLSLTLQLSEGNLFIRSNVTEGISAYLSGIPIGNVGAGLLEKLPAGDHSLVLEGDGYFWERAVTIRSGKTETIDATLQTVGALSYVIPFSGVGEIMIGNERKELRGSGTLRNIPTGTYQVKVTADNCDPLSRSVAITKGKTVAFSPELSFSKEYLSKTERDKLSGLLKNISAKASGSVRITPDLMASARNALSQIRMSDGRYKDLEDEAVKILSDLEKRKQNQDSADEYASLQKRLKTVETYLSNIVTEEMLAAAADALKTVQRSAFHFTDLEEKAKKLYDGLVRKKGEDKRVEAYSGFERKVASFSDLARSGDRVTVADVDSSIELMNTIRKSEFDFQDLVVRAGAVTELLKKSEANWVLRDKISILGDEKSGLTEELAKRKKSGASLSSTGWISIGCGLLCLAGAGVSYMLGTNAVTKYKAATTSDEALRYHKDVKNFADFMLAGAIGGGGGLSLGIILNLFVPETRSIETRMSEIDTEILTLEGELK